MLLKNVAAAAVISKVATAHEATFDHDHIKCHRPEETFHATTIIQQSNDPARAYNHILDQGLHVGTWTWPQCDQNSRLVFSHNHEPARPEQCRRQCYVPADHECNATQGAIDSEDNFAHNFRDRDHEVPILDPSNCHCQKIKCPRITREHLGPDYELVDEHDQHRDHWPMEGFNSVKVQCKENMLPENAGTGRGRTETLVCTAEGWSNPGRCYNTACINPRSAQAMEFFAPGLNLEHTWSDKDLIQLFPHGHHYDSDNDAEFRDQDAHWYSLNDDHVHFAGEHLHSYRLPYHFPRDSMSVYTSLYWDDLNGQPDHRDEHHSNVMNGAITKFTCKTGYYPYYNADIVQQYGSERVRGPQEGDSFECICNNGKWECQKHCRCEGFCPGGEY